MAGLAGEYPTRNSSMPQIINYSSPSLHIAGPLSAGVGETADGRPNTECNFLSSHYLQNHRLGTRPLEGHLGHSLVSRTICARMVSVTRGSISPLFTNRGQKKEIHCLQTQIPSTLNPFSGKWALKTKVTCQTTAFSLAVFGSMSPERAEVLNLHDFLGSDGTLVLWAFSGFFILSLLEITEAAQVFLFPGYIYKILKSQPKSFKSLHHYVNVVYHHEFLITPQLIVKKK